MADALGTFKDIMSIVGPFIGIIIGSVMTYWFNSQNEKRRDLKEKEKTEELNYKFRNLIIAKLTNLHIELDVLPNRNPSDVKLIESAFESSKIQSIRVDIESRPEIYSLESFSLRLIEGLRKSKGEREILEFIQGMGPSDRLLKKNNRNC
jgi:hypothetical protein